MRNKEDKVGSMIRDIADTLDLDLSAVNTTGVDIWILSVGAKQFFKVD